MDTPAQSINDIIKNPNNELGRLVNRVNQLKSLNALLQTMLPDHLKHRCQVANIDRQCLTLATNSGTWATQLRYQSNTILHQLRQQAAYASLGRIRIIIDPGL